jgi:hypothetical protein
MRRWGAFGPDAPLVRVLCGVVVGNAYLGATRAIDRRPADRVKGEGEKPPLTLLFLEIK